MHSLFVFLHTLLNVISLCTSAVLHHLRPLKEGRISRTIVRRSVSSSQIIIRNIRKLCGNVDIRKIFTYNKYLSYIKAEVL